MKPLKIVLIVLGAVVLSWVLLIGTCVGGIFLATRGVAEAGDRFVATCGAQKIHECYQLTASELRAQQDEAAFGADVKQRGLDRARSASWNSRNVENGSGRVAGSVTLDDGRQVPVELDLVKQDGQWRISAVK